MGCLALAMEVHWRQVCDSARTRGSAIATRWLGYALLTASLVCCLVADTATMAVLVWMVLLAVGALVVAFTLSWHPRLLGPLTFSGRRARRTSRRSSVR
jgi:FtsH-binding integral membrane protein